MSWPLGYGKDGILYRTRLGGIVLVDGIEVTGLDGWLDVPSLPSALAFGAPVIVGIQVRARPDARGRTYLFAGAVRADGRTYDDVHAIDAPWVGAWLGSLAEAVHAAIGRKVQSSSRAATVPARRIVPALDRVVGAPAMPAAPRQSTRPPTLSHERAGRG